MVLAIEIAVLGVCFFISIVNFYFQNARYKSMPQIERKKFNVLNSPTAWAIYSLVFGLIIAFIFCESYFNILKGFSNVIQQTSN